MFSLNTQRENNEPGYAESDPSPEQIQERALAIRRKWSERTRHRRWATTHPTWEAPLVKICDIAAAAHNN